MALIREWYRDRVGERRQASTWTVQLRDHRGVVRRFRTGSASKTIAAEHERRLLELRDVASASLPMPDHLARWLDRLKVARLEQLSEWGLIDRSRVSGARTLLEHLEEFRGFLNHSGAGTGEQTANRVRRVVEFLRWAQWTDARSSDLMRWRHHQTATLGHGPQTRNHYLAAVKQFFRWLEAEGRCGPSPFAAVKQERVRGGERRKRRTIGFDEFQRLLDVAASGSPFAATTGGTRFEIDGPDRSLLYWLAGHTGMRRGELESLRVADLRLIDGLAVVTPRKTKTETNAAAPMPIVDRGLVAALTASVRGKLPAAPLLRVPPKNLSAAMLRVDLEAARIAYVTEEGFFDFGALRHYADSQLKRSGLPLDVIKRRMRHANYSQTLDRYGLAGFSDELEALKRLPSPTPPAALAIG